MNRQLKYLLQAAWIVLIHFGVGYLAAWVYFPTQWAVLAGVIVAAFATVIYLTLIAVDAADKGLPIAILLVISPVVWLTGVAIMWVVRRIAEQLGLFS